MKEKEIPFRQIHLDFHTSEKIQGVCGEFDAEEFAQTLEDAHVNFYHFILMWTSWKSLLQFQKISGNDSSGTGT